MAGSQTQSRAPSNGGIKGKLERLIVGCCQTTLPTLPVSDLVWEDSDLFGQIFMAKYIPWILQIESPDIAPPLGRDLEVAIADKINVITTCIGGHTVLSVSYTVRNYPQ